MNLLAEKRNTATWDNANVKFSATADALVKSYVYDSSATTTIAGLKDTQDKTLRDLGMTYYFENTTGTATIADRVYLKELSTEIYANPNDPTEALSNPDYFNEVMSVQAGGTLAFVNAQQGADHKLFIYKPNNSNTFKSGKGNTYEVDGNEQYTVVIKDGTTYNFTGTEDEIEIVPATNTIIVKDQATAVKYLGEHIDTDNFYPTATGLFIFKRNADKDATTNDPTTSDYEFSGYFYVQANDTTDGETETGWDTNATTTFSKQGKYFALQYVNDSSNRSDFVLEDTSVSVTTNTDGSVTIAPTATLPLFTATQQVYENTDLTWKYYANTAYYLGKAYSKNGATWTDISTGTALDNSDSSASNYAFDNAAITALNALDTTPMYVVKPTTSPTSKLQIDIALADTIVGSGKNYTGKTLVTSVTDAATQTDNAETWTRIQGDTADIDTFYYNNDLEEGATTARFVDNVTLDGAVTQYDFLAFDFDLNIFSDSIQVTPDSNGKEVTDNNVQAWAAAAKNGATSNTGRATAASGTKINSADDTEITHISWAKS